MSSGVEAEIALDAAVVLSLGTNRLLGGAAGLAAGGAEALAALAEGKAEAREAALREAQAYEASVRAALDVNARITALRDSRKRAAEAYGVSADAALPEPLVLGGRSAEELGALRAEAEAALAEAEARISADIAAAMTGHIFALPAEGLRAAQGLDRRGAVSRPEAGPDPRAETLTRVLARVLPDAAEGDRRHIAEAAQSVAAARTAGEAEGLLTEVRFRVQSANERTRLVRAQARRLAEEQEALRQAEDERKYMLETITAAFAQMGYEVDTGFETMTAKDGAVLLTRGDWPEHAVKMRIDQTEDAAQGAPGCIRTPAHATLRAAMLRAGPPQSEEERRIDVEREREWCDAFEEARARLSAGGVRSDVRWRIEPGRQELPTAPEARKARNRAQHERERQRERPE